ncbi:MAG: hypothetical protein Q9220_002643 [cf. Caloplaca sp. 1 TL-2023]
MKVFLLGATGNLGSRLIPALLVHKHTVVCYIRSESKLRQLVDPAAISKCTIVTGDATNATAIASAIVENRCDALINSAGMAAIFPWQDAKMQGIIQAVATATVEASKQLGWPPGTKISDYFPFFWEHALTHTHLSGKPSENLQWSLLAPSAMMPAKKEITLLESPQNHPFVAKNDVPPAFSPTFMSGVPFFGPWADIVMNILRYNTTLEDCADFMAADLEKKGNSEHVGHRVGVIVDSKKKVQ